MRRALKKKYGKPPVQYREVLQALLEKETPEGDAFIREDRLYRNPNFIASEKWKVQCEAADMTNPELPLYPNPTRDCSWDCPFRSPCLAMDDGADWEQMIADGYIQKGDLRKSWRSRLVLPGQGKSDEEQNPAV